MSPVNQAEYARHKGVNRSTVLRWIERGRIPVRQDGLIDVAEADAALQATASPLPHHMARAEQAQQLRASGAVAAPATPATGATDDSGGRGQGVLDLKPPSESVTISQRLNTARAQTEEMKADLARMERDEKAKSLLRRSDVEFVLADIGRTVGSLLDRLADRYTPDVLAKGGDSHGVHRVLTEAARDIRTEVAHTLKRRGEELL